MAMTDREIVKLYNNLAASERELHKIYTNDLILKARAEAITEFAERLKRRYKDFCVDEGDMAFVVDSIVKEWGV